PAFRDGFAGKRGGDVQRGGADFVAVAFHAGLQIVEGGFTEGGSENVERGALDVALLGVVAQLNQLTCKGDAGVLVAVLDESLSERELGLGDLVVLVPFVFAGGVGGFFERGRGRSVANVG